MSPEMFEALFYLLTALLLVWVVYDMNRVRTFTTRPPDKCPEGRDCPRRLTYTMVPGKGIGMKSNLVEAMAAGCCKLKKDLDAAEKLCQTLEANGQKITRLRLRDPDDKS